MLRQTVTKVSAFMLLVESIVELLYLHFVDTFTKMKQLYCYEDQVSD